MSPQPSERTIDLDGEREARPNQPERVRIERIIDPLTRVTKENADDFGKKWEKWLANK